MTMRGFHNELPARFAIIECPQLRVNDDRAAHDALTECAHGYRDAHSPDGTGAPGAVPGADAARTIFRALGLDPTKRRPSSESLLRRALRDMEQPHVNNVVDALNLVSLRALLPLGLYDAARIDGEVTARVGRDGEAYDALTGASLALAGRPLLADAEGPFGTPITDSVRTSITADTTSCAVYLYAPLDSDAGELRGHAEFAATCLREFCDGAACVIGEG